MTMISINFWYSLMLLKSLNIFLAFLIPTNNPSHLRAAYLLPSVTALCLSMREAYCIALQNLSLPYVLLSQAIVLSRVTGLDDMTQFR